MKILVLNCGSSSLKYRLFDAQERITQIVSGIVERIGEPQGRATLLSTPRVRTMLAPFANHQEALQAAFAQLAEAGIVQDLSELDLCAHRVVHGGARYVAPVWIDDEVVCTIERLIPLAPLHNPANLEGIEAIRTLAPHLPQVACFDTAFHQSMPPEAYRYALPTELYSQEGIRRYGFHGLSHHYLSEEAAKVLQRPIETLKLITLHLGNGASVTAISEGRSIDTSMGFTPMEGLVMGTRCGDLDPGILLYLQRHLSMDPQELDRMLNRQSGLKGIAGVRDMREILRKKEEGDSDAALAFALFCYRIRKYIGAYIAILGGVDALVFSGGIGAHSLQVRAAVCSQMAHLGILPDEARNEALLGERGAFEREGSPVALLVIPTDEELMIARQSLALMQRLKAGS